jgi:hypothetical protein
VTDEVVVGHKQDAVGDQTKRKKVMAGGPKEQGSRPPKELQDEDASDKPFVELVKAQAAETKRVSDVRQDSGVIAVIDGEKGAGVEEETRD